MLSLIVWLLFAFICGWIAKEKNRNVGGWVVLGLLFGIISLIIVACLPKLNK
jgi:biotin transporter BioY